ncbi:MAG: glutathione-disulfide reductase [Gammaproteobacteria bacterium]|nr:MAG: glutathione-disulfide reductase [Gammaproteobacteria bacterium]
MVSPQDYDLVALGGGSGGLAAAQRAAAHGARCAVVDPRPLGGTCVNAGCIPKKLLWLAAGTAQAVEEAPAYGLILPEGQPRLRWDRLKAAREAYVARLNALYARRLEAAGIAHHALRGRLAGPGRVELEDGTRLRARHVVLATGARPVVPEVPGAELGLTSDGFFALEALPERVAVVGAGYIAAELASLLQALGRRVTLVLRGRRLLRAFDPLLGDTLAEILEEEGVDLLGGLEVARVERREEEGLVLHGRDGRCSGGHQLLLWAVGRRPASEGLGLEEAGVELDPRGAVVTDPWLQTSVPGVHAVGDLTGGPALTPVAIAQGRALADHLFGPGSAQLPEPGRIPPEQVPTVVFTHPPLGAVGLTEDQARERYGDAVRVFQSRFVPLAHALTRRRHPAAVKLVCLEPGLRVLGCHVIGPGADELLQGFAVALRMGATKADLDRTLAIHPTLAEELVTLR